jgi:hypothetical protein
MDYWPMLNVQYIVHITGADFKVTHLPNIPDAFMNTPCKVHVRCLKGSDMIIFTDACTICHPITFPGTWVTWNITLHSALKAMI